MHCFLKQSHLYPTTPFPRSSLLNSLLPHKTVQACWTRQQAPCLQSVSRRDLQGSIIRNEVPASEVERHWCNVHSHICYPQALPIGHPVRKVEESLAVARNRGYRIVSACGRILQHPRAFRYGGHFGVCVNRCGQTHALSRQHCCTHTGQLYTLTTAVSRCMCLYWPPTNLLRAWEVTVSIKPPPLAASGDGIRPDGAEVIYLGS